MATVPLSSPSTISHPGDRELCTLHAFFIPSRRVAAACREFDHHHRITTSHRIASHRSELRHRTSMQQTVKTTWEPLHLQVIWFNMSPTYKVDHSRLYSIVQGTLYTIRGQLITSLLFSNKVRVFIYL